MTSLNFFKSDLLATPHAFFTRQGGISQGFYSSLNFASSKEDPLANVQHNRSLVADEFEVSPQNLLIPNQIHGKDVLYIDQPFPLEPTRERPAVDGLITQNPNLLLGITTADCVPVLFFDPLTQTVAAVHAGWRGTLKGIIPQTLLSLKALKVKPQSLQVAIGPCISQPHFEVGPEVYHDFLDCSPWALSFFQPSSQKDYYLFDLAGYIKAQLEQAGVKTLDIISGCTYANPDLFYSCRRAHHQGEPTFGTSLSVIKLPFFYEAPFRILSSRPSSSMMPYLLK